MRHDQHPTTTVRETGSTPEQGGSSVALDEGGNLVIVQPAVERDEWRFSGITSIIEEQIQERLIRTLRFAARVLDHIDSSRRISHVAVVTALRGGGHMPWRTREEQQRSPNAASMNMRATDRSQIAALRPRLARPATTVTPTAAEGVVRAARPATSRTPNIRSSAATPHDSGKLIAPCPPTRPRSRRTRGST